MSLLTNNSATCEVYLLGTFKVVPKSADIPQPLPNEVKGSESCGANYAPLAIVIVLVVLGLLTSALLYFKDAKSEYVEVNRVAASVEMDFSSLQGPRDIESLPEKASETDKVASPTNHSAPNNLHKPCFRRLFLESHCLIGLFVHSSELKRWTKTAVWSAVLAGEMAFIGARYKREEHEGGNSSQADIWAEYNSSDFLHCLSALGIGLGLAIVLFGFFTAAGKSNLAIKRPLTRTAAVAAAVVLCVSLGCTAYMSQDLCFEEGGKWAVSCLPLVLGELVICQPLVALLRAALIKLIG
jgi:hypothetical protein